jgi:hypothetical protein
MLKIAEVKLSSWSCGLQKNLWLRKCELWIAIVEVLPSSCGIVIADSKKSCACPPQVSTHSSETLHEWLILTRRWRLIRGTHYSCTTNQNMLTVENALLKRIPSIYLFWNFAFALFRATVLSLYFLPLSSHLIFSQLSSRLIFLQLCSHLIYRNCALALLLAIVLLPYFSQLCSRLISSNCAVALFLATVLSPYF